VSDCFIYVLTWLNVGFSSAIDRSTTIILYFLSFRGAAMKETWASTMSPTRKIWGFTVSTLFILVSIVISGLVCSFHTFSRPSKHSHVLDSSTLHFLHHARAPRFSGIQGSHEDQLLAKWGQSPSRVLRALM
jgi:hypothetical protein